MKPLGAAHLGDLDELAGLVTAAAVLDPVGLIGSYPPAAFRRTLEINLLGTHLADPLVPAGAARRQGIDRHLWRRWRYVAAPALRRVRVLEGGRRTADRESGVRARAGWDNESTASHPVSWHRNPRGHARRGTVGRRSRLLRADSARARGRRISRRARPQTWSACCSKASHSPGSSCPLSGIRGGIGDFTSVSRVIRTLATVRRIDGTAFIAAGSGGESRDAERRHSCP